MTLQAIIAALLALLAWFNVTAPHTAHVARPAPARASRGVERTHAAAAPTGPNWAALRQCESGGRYSADTGNGYYGAYQADRRTWDGYWKRHARPDLVGTNPARSSRETQDAFAAGLYAERGRQPWPVCGRLL